MDRLKNSPKIALAFIFVGLIVVIYFTSRVTQIATTPPVIVTQRPTTTTIEDSLRRIQLVEISPASGERSTFDTFEIITLTFSETVDPNSLDIEIRPGLKTRTIYSEDNPNVISIVPDPFGWKEKVLYTVSIKDVSGAGGTRLNEIYEFTYQNFFPDLSGETPPF